MTVLSHIGLVQLLIGQELVKFGPSEEGFQSENRFQVFGP